MQSTQKKMFLRHPMLAFKHKMKSWGVDYAKHEQEKKQDAKVTSDYNPMTYKYYHEVIKGKAPKNAPTYQAPEKITDKETWACQICGYIYEGDLTKEPEDFVCPICKQPKSMFKKQ